MLSALPQLLGRNFLVGYFFPSAVFVLLSYHVVRKLSELGWFSPIAAADRLTRATILALAAAALAVVLALINRFLIRRMEGYGWPFNWWTAPRARQVLKYRQLQAELKDYELKWEHYLRCGGKVLAEARQRRNKRLSESVLYFPDNENSVLPTSIGNIIRAFEVYPRVKYGLDSIPGWFRLLAVIPDEYLKHTLDAKAKVDFCVNFFCLAFLLEILLVVSLLAPRHGGILCILLLINVGVMYLAWISIKQSALAWGDFVKSCFDLYIGDLAEQLGYSAPPSRETWADITQAFLYPDELPAKPSRSQIKRP